MIQVTPANELVIAYLRHFMGVRYQWGGNNPIEGFDCSGFVGEGLKYVGLIRNHDDISSHALYQCFSPISEVCKPPYKPGTLLFFGTKLKVIHVAIASDWFTMLEAGGGNQSVISDSTASARNAFVRERPIFSRTDFVIALYPPYPYLSSNGSTQRPSSVPQASEEDEKEEAPQV
jgi:hypothetical protein